MDETIHIDDRPHRSNIILIIAKFGGWNSKVMQAKNLEQK